jgi:hypothetical protein
MIDSLLQEISLKTESEYKQLDVYSPDFLKNLNAKYSRERRDRKADCSNFYS